MKPSVATPKTRLKIQVISFLLIILMIGGALSFVVGIIYIFQDYQNPTPTVQTWPTLAQTTTIPTELPETPTPDLPPELPTATVDYTVLIQATNIPEPTPTQTETTIPTTPPEPTSIIETDPTVIPVDAPEQFMPDVLSFCINGEDCLFGSPAVDQLGNTIADGTTLVVTIDDPLFEFQYNKRRQVGPTFTVKDNKIEIRLITNESVGQHTFRVSTPTQQDVAIFHIDIADPQ